MKSAYDLYLAWRAGRAERKARSEILAKWPRTESLTAPVQAIVRGRISRVHIVRGGEYSLVIRIGLDEKSVIEGIRELPGALVTLTVHGRPNDDLAHSRNVGSGPLDGKQLADAGGLYGRAQPEDGD